MFSVKQLAGLHKGSIICTHADKNFIFLLSEKSLTIWVTYTESEQLNAWHTFRIIHSNDINAIAMYNNNNNTNYTDNNNIISNITVVR